MASLVPTTIEPVLSPTVLRTYVTFLAIYAKDGRATIRRVAKARGNSQGLVHLHMRKLRELGLLEFIDKAHYSARPLYRLELFT